MPLSSLLRTRIAKMIGSLFVAGLVANEIRGALLAVPVLWGMYQSGGAWMAIWLGFCSLGGIALSVVVPLFVGRRLVAALG